MMTASKFKPSKTVPATQANRRFCELLRGDSEAGQSYIVNHHSRALAKMLLVVGRDNEGAVRRRAHQRPMKGPHAQPALNRGTFIRIDASND